jgi:hypothetical protein
LFDFRTVLDLLTFSSLCYMFLTCTSIIQQMCDFRTINCLISVNMNAFFKHNNLYLYEFWVLFCYLHHVVLNVSIWNDSQVKVLKNTIMRWLKEIMWKFQWAWAYNFQNETLDGFNWQWTLVPHGRNWNNQKKDLLIKTTLYIWGMSNYLDPILHVESLESTKL